MYITLPLYGFIVLLFIDKEFVFWYKAVICRLLSRLLQSSWFQNWENDWHLGGCTLTHSQPHPVQRNCSGMIWRRCLIRVWTLSSGLAFRNHIKSLYLLFIYESNIWIYEFLRYHNRSCDLSHNRLVPSDCHQGGVPLGETLLVAFCCCGCVFWPYVVVYQWYSCGVYHWCDSVFMFLVHPWAFRTGKACEERMVPGEPQAAAS